MDNMKIYNAVREVPDNAKKPINAGRLKGMTDIKPMWRIAKLTEVFGPCGVGWWYEITDKRIITDDITKQAAAFVDILLYYVDPETGVTSHGIPGTGGSSFVAQERNGPYLSDECFKMALTDAISVAAKAIGVGADVYWASGQSKYSGGAEAPERPKADEMRFICEECGEVLRPYTGKDGKKVGVRQHAMGSQAKFEGHIYCLDCIKKRQGA
jgi:hypothetical protein